MLIYVNIIDRQTDKHIKSIVRNLTKWNFFLVYTTEVRRPQKNEKILPFLQAVTPKRNRHNVPKVYFWPLTPLLVKTRQKAQEFAHLLGDKRQLVTSRPWHGTLPDHSAPRRLARLRQVIPTLEYLAEDRIVRLFGDRTLSSGSERRHVPVGLLYVF